MGKPKEGRSCCTPEGPDTLDVFVRNTEGCEDTHHPLETDDNGEDFVPKDIPVRRTQDICAGSNKSRKADHYLVIWEGHPLKNDYTWDPIENLYDQEKLVETHEKWLKTERKA